MYVYREGCIYTEGKWSFADIEELTITEALDKSRYLIVTANITGGGIAVIEPTVFFKIINKSQTVGYFVQHYTEKLPELVGDLEVRRSKYHDLVDVERIGNDYLLRENHPFVLHSTGIWQTNNRLVSGIDVSVAASYDPVVGVFDVGLPFVKRHLRKEDITRKHGHLPKVFNLNNTLMVFGNSIVKIDSLLHDIGDEYVYTYVLREVITNLFMDNLDRIPPVMVGLDPLHLDRTAFNNDNTLAEILAHPSVYFIEYQYKYPLGLDTTTSGGGIIAEYTDELVMLNNKPTTLKVLHTVDRFTIPATVAEVNQRYYNTNPYNDVLSGDSLLTEVQGTLYTLDYPYFTVKE